MSAALRRRLIGERLGGSRPWDLRAVGEHVFTPHSPFSPKHPCTRPMSAAPPAIVYTRAAASCVGAGGGGGVEGIKTLCNSSAGRHQGMPAMLPCQAGLPAHSLHARNGQQAQMAQMARKAHKALSRHKA